MAIAEKKVLLIDIDPQANATSGLGFSNDGIRHSVYDLFVSDIDINKLVLNTDLPFFKLIPSEVGLVGAEIELTNQEDRHKKLKSSLVK